MRAVVVLVAAVHVIIMEMTLLKVEILYDLVLLVWGNQGHEDLLGILSGTR